MNNTISIIILIIIVLISQIILLSPWWIYNSQKRMHSSSWLLKKSTKFVNKSKCPHKMRSVLKQLYKTNFKFLSHDDKSLLLLANIIKKDETIVQAFCGIYYLLGNNTVMLVITSKRILFINGPYNTTITIYPKFVKHIQYKSRTPLFHKYGLKLSFMNPHKNFYSLFIQLISKKECDWLAQTIQQRK